MGPWKRYELQSNQPSFGFVTISWVLLSRWLLSALFFSPVKWTDPTAVLTGCCENVCKRHKWPGSMQTMDSSFPFLHDILNCPVCFCAYVEIGKFQSFLKIPYFLCYFIGYCFLERDKETNNGLQMERDLCSDKQIAPPFGDWVFQNRFNIQ